MKNKIKNPFKIIGLITLAFVLTSNVVYADRFSDAMEEITNGENKVKQKFNELEATPDNFMDKYPNKIDVNIPDGQTIEFFNLDAYSGFPQIGQFREYTEQEFQKSLNIYKGMYDNKKEELENKYIIYKNKVLQNEKDSITSYYSMASNLEKEYQNDVSNMINKYNSKKNELKSNYNELDAYYKKFYEDTYKKGIEELNDWLPNEALKYWDQEAYDKYLIDFEQINDKIDKQVKEIMTDYSKAESFIANTLIKIEEIKTLDLMQYLHKNYPEIKSQYNPEEIIANMNAIIKKHKTPHEKPTWDDMFSELITPEQLKQQSSPYQQELLSEEEMNKFYEIYMGWSEEFKDKLKDEFQKNWGIDNN